MNYTNKNFFIVAAGVATIISLGFIALFAGILIYFN